MKHSELAALLKLLDDSDKEVYDLVSLQLTKMGNEVVPFLEKAWENSLNDVFQSRIENIIQAIQFKSVISGLENWVQQEKPDLFLGAFLVAQYQYPDLKIGILEQKLSEIENDLKREYNNHLTALEKVKIINHIFFDIHKFSRNTTNYYAPQNSYINHVLNEKKGNSISMSIIYAVLAQRLGLPVFGVNLPKNFILAYLDERASKLENPEQTTVLFYINPYNRGAVLGKKEIDYFVKQQNLEPTSSYYLPCSTITLIERLIFNLIYSYEKLGYPDKIQQLELLYDVVSKGNTSKEY